jgi:hypothetical protein
MLGLLYSATTALPAFATLVPTVYEDFDVDTDAYWVGVGNRASSRNFGWASTDLTGTAINPPSGVPATAGGEMGGDIARNGTVPAYYGFATGAITANDTLHADGVYRYWFGSSSWYIGWFKAATTTSPGDPRNFIGFQFDDSKDIYTHFANGSGRDRAGRHTILPTNQTIRWSIDYDPDANGGNGQITGNVNGVAFTHPVPAGYKTGLLSSGPLDRFGLYPVANGAAPGGGFFDDVTFSSFTEIPGGPFPKIWTANSDGNWFVAGNWIGGVPNAVDVEVTLGGAITAARLIYAESAVTVGRINFDSTNMYLLTGLQTLTLQVSSGSAMLNVKQGSHKVNLPLVLQHTRFCG